MDIKTLIAGTAIGAIVVGSAWVICTKSNVEEECIKREVKSEVQEQVSYNQDEKRVLELEKIEKKYFEEYKSEGNEVTIRNTSGTNFKKIEFKIGDVTYELYNVLKDESYKIVSYDLDAKNNLKVISIDYEIPNYYPEEVDLTLNITTDKISGKVINNGQRDLYPSQVIVFLKDSKGNTIQKTIEYAGCFFEGLVIKPNAEFEFELDIPSEYTLARNKGIIFRYSDLEFRMYDTKIIEKM